MPRGEARDKRQELLAARIAGENQDAWDEFMGRSGPLFEAQRAKERAMDRGDFEEAVRQREIEKRLTGEE